jgi:hypothetical protein
MVHIINNLPIPAKTQVLNFVKKESKIMHESLKVYDKFGKPVRIEICRFYSEPDIILHFNGHECRLNENLNIVRSDIGLNECVTL